MAKTHDNNFDNTEAFVPVVASSKVEHTSLDSLALPCAFASPIAFEYFDSGLSLRKSISASSLSCSDDGADSPQIFDRETDTVPLVAACCYADDVDLGPCDVIAQNVDLFDLNTTVDMEVADHIDRQGSAMHSDAVQCFYIPQVCELVDTDMPALDLTEEEAALLMDLMDKSSLSSGPGDIALQDTLSKEMYKSDSSELDNIIMDMYFESDELAERQQTSQEQSYPTEPIAYMPTIKVEKTWKLPKGKSSMSVKHNEPVMKKRKRGQESPSKRGPRTAKQLATAKRPRTNGQFARCKIKWIPACALTEYGGDKSS